MFHVFYQLLAGASIEERKFLGLEAPQSTLFLQLVVLSVFQVVRMGSTASLDQTTWSPEELRDALRALEFKPKTVNAILGVPRRHPHSWQRQVFWELVRWEARWRA